MALIYPNAKYVHLQRNPSNVIRSLKRFIQSRKPKIIWTRKWWRRGMRKILSINRRHLFQKVRWLRFPSKGYLGVRPKGFQKALHMSSLEFLVWYFNSIESNIQRHIKDLPNGRVFKLSYDGFVTNYVDEIHRLCEFLGVNAEDDFVERSRKWANINRVNRYQQENWSPEEEKILSGLITRENN
jgi:hypothetical protein